MWSVVLSQTEKEKYPMTSAIGRILKRRKETKKQRTDPLVAGGAQGPTWVQGVKRYKRAVMNQSQGVDAWCGDSGGSTGLCS